jgi:hypothetical protein
MIRSTASSSHQYNYRLLHGIHGQYPRQWTDVGLSLPMSASYATRVEIASSEGSGITPAAFHLR